MPAKGASPPPLPFSLSSPPAPTAGPAVLQLPEAPTLEVALLLLGPERRTTGSSPTSRPRTPEGPCLVATPCQAGEGTIPSSLE